MCPVGGKSQSLLLNFAPVNIGDNQGELHASNSAPSNDDSIKADVATRLTVVIPA